MTCKDCYFNEVCVGVNSILAPRTYPNCYKDKNKIIELPCKVGDTVYIVDEYSDENKGYDECRIKAFHFNGSFVYFEVDIDEIDMFDVSYIGKRVFLTREEAENEVKKEEDSNG